MTSSLIRRGLIAASLAGTVLAASAQAPGAQPSPQGPAMMQGMGPGMGPGMMAGRPDPAARTQHMAERHIARMAVLKSRLKLAPEQEAAWRSFEEGMKPTPRTPPPPAEMATLSTPERMERMQAHLADRQAELKKRTDVVKAFYATLSADQKKTFDQSARQAKHGGGHPGMHPGMHPGHHGMHSGPRG